MNRRWGCPLPILLGLVLIAAIVLVSSCDRTRPRPGMETAAPVVTDGGGATVPAPSTGAAGGPVQTAEGWKFTFADAAASSVHLAGSFNDWSTSTDALTKGSDGVWFVVKKLGSGVYQYKFVINGTNWIEDPKNPNKADDGFGGSNSELTVP